ncbi:hypothetical protein GCM10025865_00560 [Paraoerskovia sediminicola]|uniref:50S ribosome-binding GTPase n=1 Tax=Paraoerskovia sediminicola TaxID=1138587 RepID=A0ABN6XAT2_9CELL|nr:ABC transporter [Paraoerskovia sediminicola]BDZ40757.1 hypothetical protein GCM10025865_00560 [Paraoerskovia sediminicola]
MTSDDKDLRGRTNDLQKAVDLAGDRVPAEVSTLVRAAIAGVRERLDLGVDHTVVALAGGTGSGKSSLFNRVSRLDFADVGIRRPTTAQITACAWSGAATPLLDWLEVIPERRITRGHELDAADEGTLSGLVLLDLPDHDSIEPAHRVVVDRVLPFVDLLLWVVDPQKYADDALHSDYLRKSVGLESSMVVAINQIDTVPEGHRGELVADLDRLLVEDGLHGVHVLTVSAATGEGVGDVMALLERAVARRSVSASRVAGELDTAGARLVAETPSDAPWNADAAIGTEVDALAEAVGLDSVAAQVGDAVRSGYGRPTFEPPQKDGLEVSRNRWLSRAGKGLRPGWRASLDGSVASSRTVGERLERRLSALPLDTTGPASVPVLRRTGAALMVLGAIAGVLGLLEVLGVVDLFEAGLTTVLLVGAAACVLVGVVLVVVVAQVMRRAVRRRERDVRERGRSVVASVVGECFADPTRALLAEHRQVRELAQSARERERIAPLTGSIRLPTGAHLKVASTAGTTGGDATAPAS